MRQATTLAQSGQEGTIAGTATPVNAICSKRYHTHYSRQPGLFKRHYRRTTTVFRSVLGVRKPTSPEILGANVPLRPQRGSSCAHRAPVMFFSCKARAPLVLRSCLVYAPLTLGLPLPLSPVSTAKHFHTSVVCGRQGNPGSIPGFLTAETGLLLCAMF